MLTTKDLEKFSRKLGKMIGSGIPLVKTLKLISNEDPESEMGKIVEQVAKKLTEGYTFSSCLSMFPGVFTETYVAMVKAAESQGKLDEGMLEIADSCSDGTLEVGNGSCEANEEAISPDEENLKVIKLMNGIITDAVREKTTRVVCKPERDHVKLLIDRSGALQHRETFDKNIFDRITARVKMMAALDIAERRLPQDGRALVKVESEMIDIRVTVAPTVFGEQISMFFTRPDEKEPTTDRIFHDKEQQQQFENLIKNQKTGLIIFAGPHGSGKTTTMMVAASQLNDGTRIIFDVGTIYKSPSGISCMRVLPQIGLTNVQAIRSAARSEPEVIIVEDFSDEETALESFKIATSGTLVMTQIGARNSAEVFRQIFNMKVPPFMVYGGIAAVIFQFLARKLCPHCRKEAELTAEDLSRLNLSQINPGKYSDSCGCEKCDNSGYLGREAFYEIIIPDKPLKEAIIKGDNDAIALVLSETNKRSLESRIMEYMQAGNTSPHEVARLMSIIKPQEPV